MWDESKHPRDKYGKFSENPDGAGGEHKATPAEEKRLKELGIEKGVTEGNSANKKLTPAEKIASVHIDFDRDNILPELNEEDLVKVGSKTNKPVLLKKNIINRNAVEHSDLTNDDFEKIITNALYSPSEIFSANKEKPYYHFAKLIEINSKCKSEIGLALLDVDEKKDNFEVVHAHFVEVPRLDKMIKKGSKKD